MTVKWQERIRSVTFQAKVLCLETIVNPVKGKVLLLKTKYIFIFFFFTLSYYISALQKLEESGSLGKEEAFFSCFHLLVMEKIIISHG